MTKCDGLDFRYLNMSYNLVRQLPRFGFRGLDTLETIDLSYNDIREIDERAFDDMRWVTTLKVRWRENTPL